MGAAYRDAGDLPHAERLHSIDERVWLPSVLQSAQALALFIASWCGLSQS